MPVSKWSTTAGIVLVALGIQGCSEVGMNQSSQDVVVRLPGEFTYSESRMVRTTANTHWPYAFMSALAYNQANALEPSKHFTCTTDPETKLRDAGWEEWAPRFPTTRRHLRIRVWDHPDAGKDGRGVIAVAFAGTELHPRDWQANLRWFLPGKDQYTEVTEEFSRWFQERVTQESAKPEKAHLHDAQLYVTGHSLGGGLAQYFAFTNTRNEARKPIQVFAFAPSPVTGRGVVRKEYGENYASGVQIEWIFERSEILAALRLMLSWLPPKFADSAPSITTIRYAGHWKNYFTPMNPIAPHSITQLACLTLSESGMSGTSLQRR